MVGILMVSHGRMAEGIADSLYMIVGKIEQLDYLGLFEGTDFEEFKETMHDKLVKLDTGDGVVVMTDLFGASPYNAAAGNMNTWMKEGHRVRLLTGMNLPMVIEAVSQRFSEVTLDQLYPAIMETAKAEIKELMHDLGLEGQ